MNRNRLATSILTVALYGITYTAIMLLAKDTLSVVYAIPRFTPFSVGTMLVATAVVIIRDQRLEQGPERWARIKESFGAALAVSGGVIIGSIVFP